MPTVPSLGRGRGWALALCATFTMAVSYLDRQTLAVLAPTVTAELRIDEQAYGWLVSAFSFAYFAGPPLAGRWLDRVGARRGLMLSVLLWSLVAGGHSLVTGFPLLVAMRLALGLAESPSYPGAAQIIQRGLRPEDRPRAFGILFTGSSFGAMVAPPLATFFAGWLGWRGAFLGTALVGLSWVPLWIWLTRSSAARAALDHAPAAPAAATGRSEWLGLLRDPAVLRAGALVLAVAPFIGVVMNWGAKFLVRHHGLAPLDVGRYLWIPPLLYDGGSILFGHWASRRANRVRDGSPARGLLALASLLTLALFAMPFAPTPLTAMLVAGVALVGGGGMFALLSSDMLARVPARLVSSASGLTAAAQSLSYIIVNPLVGRSVDRWHSFTPALIALTLWVVPGTLLWLLWVPKTADPAPAV